VVVVLITLKIVHIAQLVQNKLSLLAIKINEKKNRQM